MGIHELLFYLICVYVIIIVFCMNPIFEVLHIMLQSFHVIFVVNFWVSVLQLGMLKL